MITLVDYGLGNVQAFVNIYRRLNIPVNAARTAEQLSAAERIILPGVGAFDWAMTRLEESGMRGCLDDLVRRRGRPVLGVCVGMQMMANRSDEGNCAGLGWIDAEVKQFDAAAIRQPTHLPHMGWNDAKPRGTECLFRGLVEPRFYFLHSYHFAPTDLQQALAMTNYGGAFVSAVRCGNVYGTQFHPEKSHKWGIQLLQNFAEL